MNTQIFQVLLTGITDTVKYLRGQDEKKKRELYDSLVDTLKNNNIDSLHDLADKEQLEELYDAARTQAGDVTRAAHKRLDRRRAAFNAALPAREEQRKAWKAEAKQHKKKAKGNGGKIAAGIFGLAALAGAGWACWQFWLKDKLNDAPEPAPQPRTSTGEAKLVYSTTTEDDLHAEESTGVYSPDTANDTATGAHAKDADGSTGSTVLTTSLDDTRDHTEGTGEGLSTLDTLEDDQRKATRGTSTRKSRHSLRED